MSYPTSWGRWSLQMVAAMLLWLTIAGPALAADRRTIRSENRVLLAEARAFFAAGENDSALARLDAVLVTDPANPDAYYFKGLIYLSVADTSAATESLGVGVEKAPLSRRLKLLLARVQVEAGEVDGAEQLAQEVVALRPFDPDAAYVLGLVALARSDTLAALAIWENVLVEKQKGGQQ